MNANMSSADIASELRVPMLPRSRPLNLRSLTVTRFLMRVFGHLGALKLPKPNRTVVKRLTRISTPDGASLELRIHRPAGPSKQGPALLWIHGGGYVMGTASLDDRLCRFYADRADMQVVAVDYRLAPEYPFPTPLEDCYCALDWMHRNAEVLGIDASRIAIGGASAGGGLAAALALLARDRTGPKPAFQLLNYPMLDDRTGPQAGRGEWVWGADANSEAWAAYLGVCGAAQALIPGRAASLSGLPPTWLGCGTLDLFHAENKRYASSLREQGVRCEWLSVPGAYHGFDTVAPHSDASKNYFDSQLRAMRAALAH